MNSPLVQITHFIYRISNQRKNLTVELGLLLVIKEQTKLLDTTVVFLIFEIIIYISIIIRLQ
jgi:hypothetical protein